jgi:hypothetical protein
MHTPEVKAVMEAISQLSDEQIEEVVDSLRDSAKLRLADWGWDQIRDDSQQEKQDEKHQART